MRPADSGCRPRGALISLAVAGAAVGNFDWLTELRFQRVDEIAKSRESFGSHPSQSNWRLGWREANRRLNIVDQRSNQFALGFTFLSFSLTQSLSMESIDHRTTMQRMLASDCSIMSRQVWPAGTSQSHQTDQPIFSKRSLKRLAISLFSRRN